MEPQDQLTITATSERGITTLSVAGELDPITSPLLDAAFSAALSEGPNAVQIDLRDLQFIDSSGLAALISAYSASEAAHVKMTVTNPSPQCRRLLTATNLLHLVD